MDGKHGFLLIFGVALLVFCTYVGTASAGNICVPDNYTKIQWAVDNATAGDTIIVRDGKYTENVDVNRRLTIQSEAGLLQRLGFMRKRLRLLPYSFIHLHYLIRNGIPIILLGNQVSAVFAHTL